MTFHDLFIACQKDSDASVQTQTDKYNSTLNHLPKLFERKYNNLTKAEFSEWRLVIQKLNISTTTKNQLINRIKSVTKYAYMIYDLEDKAKHLKLLKKPLSEQIEMNTWTNDEFIEFIQHIDNPCLNTFFRLLFYTGMRRGEARALYKSDLSINDCTVRINKSMRRTIAQPTKTKSSIRTIHLDEDTYKRCINLRKRKGKYLFGDDHPLSNSQIQRFFNKGIIDSKVKKIRLHDLRHSNATILINNGANIVAVSKRLGHSSVKTTLTTYTHLMQDSNDSMMNLINNFKKSQ